MKLAFIDVDSSFCRVQAKGAYDSDQERKKDDCGEMV